MAANINQRALHAIRQLRALQQLEKLEELENREQQELKARRKQQELEVQDEQELESQEEQDVKRRHQFWVNPFLMLRDACDLEQYLLKDILWDEGQDYQHFYKMSVDKFNAVLALVEPTIKKQNTTMRYAITPRVRLAITLRFIGTGESYRSLEALSRVSRKTIAKFVPHVLNAIYNVLQNNIKTPATESEWLDVAKDFETYWNFPHTIGSIDGKHIRTVAPPLSGSDSYHYKGCFSIVLLGVVDAHSKFLFIDVKENGKVPDDVVFEKCSLKEGLNSGSLNIPPASPLKNQENPTPYFFVGTDVFPLDKHLMKEFDRDAKLTRQQELFNFGLSRCRLTVEMAFRRLAARFKIFHHPIDLGLENCKAVIRACCVLHNYLQPAISKRLDTELDISQILPQTMGNLKTQQLSDYKQGSAIRNNLVHYCVTDGDVPYVV